MTNTLNSYLRHKLKKLDAAQLYRRRRTISSAQGRKIVVDGTPLLNFCSNDYLGLAGDPRILAVLKRAGERYGVGSGASHLVSGHSRAHDQLEQALARFTQRQRALVFSSGYSANVAVIRSLLSTGDQIFQDRLNHASLLDGGWVSRANVHWYEHRHYLQLHQKLNHLSDDGKCVENTQRLIVSDGVFSMDGDSCDLSALTHIAKTHQAWLMIDDAHGFGVLGDKGCGLVDPKQFTTDDVPILIGTFGKACGTAGAFVAGSEELIEWLIQKARNYIYTTALPSAIALATCQSLQIIQKETWRRQHLKDLIERFVRGANQLDIPLMPSTTAIQPILLHDSALCLEVSRNLEQRGIFASAIRPPTVPVNSARIRITLSASHTEKDIDTLLGHLGELIGSTKNKVTSENTYA